MGQRFSVLHRVACTVGPCFRVECWQTTVQAGCQMVAEMGHLCIDSIDIRGAKFPRQPQGCMT